MTANKTSARPSSSMPIGSLSSERGVLARQADARVQHDMHEKRRLSFRESELRDGLDAFVERHRMNSSARRGSGALRPRPPLPPLPMRADTPRYREKPERAAAAPCAPR